MLHVTIHGSSRNRDSFPWWARLAFGVVLATALVAIAALAGSAAVAGSAPFLVALATVVFGGAGPGNPTAGATHRGVDPGSGS